MKNATTPNLRMNRLTILILILFVASQNGIAQSTFHGNIARTGAYNSPGPKQLSGTKWVFKTDGPIFSSPAIADGIVFFGSTDTNFYAIDQSTGKQKWKFKTDGAVSSSPAVANGIVYFGSFDGTLYALAADSGAVKWRFAHEGSEKRFEAKGIHGATPSNQTIPDPWDLYLSSPAISYGRVYFGSGDGNVYAVNAQTGVLQWKFVTGDVVHASPAIANNTVYIGSWDSFLYAVDAETGQEKWRFKTGEDPVIHNQVGLQSSPVVVEGTVFVGCRDAHVYAIDARTGRKKWDYYTKKSWVNATPAVADGRVYFGTSDTHLFHALDARSGRPQFTFEAKAQIFSSAAIAGDLVYVGDFLGRLYALDRKTGTLAWEFRTEGSRTDPLKVLNSEGTWNRDAFTRSFNDFADMYVNLSKRFSVGSILSSPVVDRGEIYFGSTDGFLYALQ